ncbi:translation initiation factor eIF-3b [Chiua virens]|nr:translation initiation factor eIF-3b [Chiua virens]
MLIIAPRYHVALDDGLDNVIVVDGVPVIDKSKLDKLLVKISKEFTKKGAALKPENIFVPWDNGTEKSKGYLFVDAGSADAATYAINAMHGHPFDSKHTFFVNRFVEIEQYANIDETYVEHKTEEFHPKEHLRAWLADPQGRDQYVIYRGDDVEIHWHGKPSQCEVAYSKKNWTELYASWSPLGTYFATLFRQGVRLWGGPSWEPQQRFAHPFVKLIDFSPCENYLVTWSHDPIAVSPALPQGPEYFSPEDEGNNIAVWDVKSGHLLRTFPTSLFENEDPSMKKQMQWPALKWSADDKFVARVTAGQQISVYELPSMGLHDKKSLKIEGVVDYEWCPHGDKDREDSEKATKADKPPKKARENMLAYWTPEVANQPARVTLLEFPSRQILRQKNLFHVTECKLYWQNHGDFLCVKVDRHTKTKKSIFCNLEIFRVREKDFPVEVVELKDTVTDFSWEPKGERFAIVSSIFINWIAPKTISGFYIHSHPARAIPFDGHREGGMWSSLLEERREGQMAEWGTGIQQLGSADHYGVTDVEWDPSGRYLATSASAWRHTLENGYAIWDFRGQELEKHILDRFKQFIWRPRPRPLLTREQQRQIRRNLKEYSRTFDEEDAAEESNVSAELIAHRKRLVDEWNAWRARCKRDIADEKRSRGQRLERGRGEEEKEEIEEWIDEVVEQIEEEVVE